MQTAGLTKWFENTAMGETYLVGGKGASLGEMYQKLTNLGVRVPNGFILTTQAYTDFIQAAIPESTWDNVGNPCLLYTSPSPRD